MKSVWVVAIGVVLGLSACATSGTSSATTLAAAEGEEGTVDVAEAEEELICRREQVLGSRFAKRVCATQEEWTRLRDETDNDAQYIRRSVRAQSGQSGS